MVLSLFSGKARADLCVLNSGRSCAEVNRYHVFCFCCVLFLLRVVTKVRTVGKSLVTTIFGP